MNATTKTRYKTICPTCGILPGTWLFRDDAVGEGERHQEANTNRISRLEPLAPEHACAAVQVLDIPTLVW